MMAMMSMADCLLPSSMSGRTARGSGERISGGSMGWDGSSGRWSVIAWWW
jgi:hypothetical protein